MIGIGVGPSDFFVTGGTLRPDSPSYVRRPADDELFHLASAGRFCYVLTARQMGKSSLMIRTARRLEENGVHTAIIDLTKIGTDVTIEQWYLGLLTRLKSQLELSVEPEAWWAERASLGAVQRFTDFLHDVVLAEFEEPVVIFIDEIDTTLNLDFSDDFFAAIRACYNARATDSAYNRLTFVLLGVATPADLIKDRSRTPFNIGQGIDLREFSREDARVLQQGLKAACPEGGDTIFARIFYWTNGHPYLTQKLCLAVTERGDGHWTDEQVDELVGRLFLSEEARKETNLQFVRDSIRTSSRRRELLTLYRQVYEGKTFREDERSLDQNRLKLFGLVRAESGLLQVRNEIYRRAFNLDWIKANTPTDWTRRIAFISTLLVIVLAGVIGFTIYRQGQLTAEAKAQAFVDSFRSTTSAEVRITSLAGLFDLPGYEDQARRLFHEELGPAEQLALFELADPESVGTQLITVVKGLYIDLGNNEQGNALLDAISQILHKLDNPMAINLRTEIEQWLQGRAYYNQGKYQQAVTAYDVAISLNDRNPGTYFDRGLAYAALNEPSRALADFETVLSLGEGWQDRVRQAVVSDSRLYIALWGQRDVHRALVSLVPTPTKTPTATVTPKQVPPTYTPTWTPTNTTTPTNTLTSTSTVTPTRPPTNTPRPLPTSTPMPPKITPTGMGRITFASWAARNSSTGKLEVMNVDGSGRINLAGLGYAAYSDPGHCSWSPDGQQVAFENMYDIYVVNADGSGQRSLTNDHSNNGQPSWSPDGTRIAFQSKRDGNGEIYVVNADGSGLTNLSNNLADDWQPSWSPDSQHITFRSLRDGNDEIYIMNADGSGQTNLTNNPASDKEPSWSPDSQHITFRSLRDGTNQIYAMNADGSGQTNLTNDPAGAWGASWSPDGTHIAFVSGRDGNGEVYVMNADGSGLKNLTNNPGFDYEPFWSPDGMRIAFDSDRDGYWTIYVMNANGSGQTNLTNDVGHYYTTCWSPR